MTPASRGKAWWGLGLVLVLVILGGLYFVRRSAPAPAASQSRKPSVMSRPRTPISSRRPPAKTPKATNWCRSMPPRPQGPPPPAARGGPHRQAGRQNQVLALPHASGNRPGSPRQMPHVRHGPGAGAAEEPGPRSGSRRAAAPPKERKIKYWVVAHGPRLRPGQARQGPLRHGHGPGL